MSPRPPRLPTRLAARLGAVAFVQILAFTICATLGAALAIRAVTKSMDRAWLAADEVRALGPILGDPLTMATVLGRLRRVRGVEVSVYDASRRLVATNVEPPLRWRAPGPPPFAHGSAALVVPPRPPPLDHGVFIGGFAEPPPQPTREPGSIATVHLPLEDGPRSGGAPAAAHARGPATHLGPLDALLHGPPDVIRRVELAGAAGFVLVHPAADRADFAPAVLVLALALAIVAAASLLLARSIARPLEALAEQARRLGAGDLRARSGATGGDEIADVGRAFDGMAARLERSMRAEKELLANVSHELRTPLARIRVAMDLASEGDAKAARAALDEIAIDLAELEGLVDDVMRSARLALDDGSGEPTRLSPRLEPTSVDALLARSARRFTSHHAGHGLARPTDRVEAVVLADEKLLRRAIDNLLDNAAKYSAEGSVVTLRAEATGGDVRIEVTDRGLGIDESDLPLLFTPFFRADRSRTRGTGGVGLGLTLARRIVEEHGGTIAITSRLDVGTTATITLPLAR